MTIFRAPQHVFVYGSLKVGFGNHEHFFGDNTKAMLCGTYRTKVKNYVMYDLGYFPAVAMSSTAHDKGAIEGELYLVTPHILSRLDRLEGHPNFYKRKRVLLDDGTWAFMYTITEGGSYASQELVPVKDDVYRWGPLVDSF